MKLKKMKMLMPACKIAILENYALFSSGFRSLLEGNSELEVICEGENPESLRKSLNDEKPHLIIIDMLHCSNAGYMIIKKTHEYFPDIPLILITSREYSDCFTDYLRFGVKGFVFENDSTVDLFSAIKNICLGKIHFKNKMKSFTGDHTKKQNGQKNDVLTRRELDVLKLFSDGLTYKEVGLKLFISPRTVESHKQNIMAKLNLNSTAEMIKYATRHSIASN
jgi:DNA-binding NarL/FixJ family response regulator